MSYKSGFYKGRLGIGLANTGGDGTGNPRFPLDVNGDIRLTGSLLRSDGTPYLGGGLINYIPKGIKSIVNNDGGYFVGFGTHTPTEALDISGNLKVSGQILSVDGDNFSTVVPIAQQQTTTENPTWHGDVTTTVTSSSDATSFATIASPTFTGTVTAPNLNITGNFQMNGQTPTFSNWTVHSNANDIYRPSGNVGIGTTSPKEKLDINAGKICFTGGSFDETTGISYYYKNHTTERKIMFFNGSLVLRSPWDNSAINNSGRGIFFQQYDGTNIMHLRGDNGNVGIGTTSPTQAKLVVNGSDILGIYSMGDYTDYNYILNGPRPGNTAGGAVHFINSASRTDDGGQSCYTIRNDNGPIRLGKDTQTTTIEGNDIILDGKVGIGTTSPNAPLEIHGGAGSGDEVLILSNSKDSGNYTGLHSIFLDGGAHYDVYNNSTIQTGKSTSSGESFHINRYSAGDVTMVKGGGNVGIGTTNPTAYFFNNSGTGGSFPSTERILTLQSFVSTSNPEVARLVMSCGNNHTASIYGQHTGNGNTHMGFSTTSGTAAPVERMRIDSLGNVGIGLPSPLNKLHTENIRIGDWNGSGNGFRFWQNADADLQIDYMSGSSIHRTMMIMDYDGHGIRIPNGKVEFGGVLLGEHYNSNYWGIIHKDMTEEYNYALLVENNGSTYLNSAAYANVYFRTGNNNVMTINGNSWLVGIGTTNPGAGLEIATGTNNQGGFTDTAQYLYGASTHGIDWNPGGSGGWGGGAWRDTYGGWSLHCHHEAAFGEHLFVYSDSRIKTNIVDVSDNQALTMVRNIPCRYYEYKDKLTRGYGKTIGFIAQEVKEILPMAVKKLTTIIPNEMRLLENISWEEIIHGSNNAYKLSSDLQDVSGINYRFFVSNDPSGNDECKKEIIGNSDDTFTFKEKWNNVFCYGKKVDDFHTLDKQKLFALNFSATQELDRQQQIDKAEIAELKTEVATLKSELAAIKAHLGI